MQQKIISHTRKQSTLLAVFAQIVRTPIPLSCYDYMKSKSPREKFIERK